MLSGLPVSRDFFSFATSASSGRISSMPRRICSSWTSTGGKDDIRYIGGDGLQIALTHDALHAAFRLLLSDIGALVVQFLSAREADFDLRIEIGRASCREGRWVARAGGAVEMERV